MLMFSVIAAGGQQPARFVRISFVASADSFFVSCGSSGCMHHSFSDFTAFKKMKLCVHVQPVRVASAPFITEGTDCLSH